MSISRLNQNPSSFKSKEARDQRDQRDQSSINNTSENIYDNFENNKKDSSRKVEGFILANMKNNQEKINSIKNIIFKYIKERELDL